MIVADKPFEIDFQGDSNGNNSHFVGILWWRIRQRKSEGNNSLFLKYFSGKNLRFVLKLTAIEMFAGQLWAFPLGELSKLVSADVFREKLRSKIEINTFRFCQLPLNFSNQFICSEFHGKVRASADHPMNVVDQPLLMPRIGFKIKIFR